MEGWNWLPAGLIYGVMLAAFYGGTITFTFSAILRSNSVSQVL